MPTFWPGRFAALLVIAYQPPPAHHPAERSLNHPAARQHAETLLAWQLAVITARGVNVRAWWAARGWRHAGGDDLAQIFSAVSGDGGPPFSPIP